MIQLHNFLYRAIISICITTAVAISDDLDRICSEAEPCEIVSNSTFHSTSNGAKTNTDDSMFLYFSASDINASYPVVEYLDDDSSSALQIPSFLLHLPSRTYKNHYIMVKYYKPHCKACKYVKKTYIKTALYMQFMLMNNEVPFDLLSTSNSKSSHNTDSLFRAYSISCQAYPHLCTTANIHMYPTIRMYDMNTGNTIELDYRRMHPYSIMERLGFDDTTIHSNIYQLSKHIERQHKHEHEHRQQPDKKNKLKFEQLADSDPMKQVVEEIEYTYSHIKQSDLEQDLHVTVDTMLRRYTYVPKNVNMTTKRSLRDPPLKTESAQTLRIFLELLLRVISPVRNSHLQRFHSMIKELSSSFMYISRHAGYLPVILDEFRVQPKFVSKRKNDKRWSQYSKDCAPNQPMIVITANDDDALNIGNDSGNDSDETTESSIAPYQCGLWKLLFHMIVGGGFTNYNRVATSDNDKIPEIDMVTMVRDYATHIGFGIWSDNEIQILYNTTFYNETEMNSSQKKKESSEMRLALWLGTVRNEIQRHRMMQDKDTSADVLLAQFPSVNDCPSCWNLESKRSSYLHSYHTHRYDRPLLWNDPVVYKYIRLEYGTAPDNIDELVQLYMDVHPEEFVRDKHDEL